MIVSASYKTDIPAFYGEWFRNRLDAGVTRSVNPWGGPAQSVSLRREDVDGFVFWTRNIEPFLPVLDEIGRRGFPFVVQYTVTGYPRALDQRTIAAQRAMTQLHRLRREHGPAVPVWRYDPVIFTSLTPPQWHEENFTRLCAAAAGATDEVVLSVAHIYRKTARNMDAAARTTGLSWRDPTVEEKTALLVTLAAIAAEHGLRPTLCGQPHLLVEGLTETRCVDADRLARVAGTEIPALRRPHRKRCGCFASKDIGDYDTCPHGCVYCYAVTSRARASGRLAAHDAGSEFLVPTITDPRHA